MDLTVFISALMSVIDICAPLTGDTKLTWLIPVAIVSAVLVVVLVVLGNRRR
ncbi:MAG TPA: hypothetical protein GX704_04770 [Clostridiales bacterium]|jgi:cytochrome c-type biogenesis protein CcmH/NrfF|nr:hypothetical protein [Clostridiales bacterium]